MVKVSEIVSPFICAEMVTVFGAVTAPLGWTACGARTVCAEARHETMRIRNSSEDAIVMNENVLITALLSG
jgi:hypothetical protein